jgi:hypothetical protein
MGRRFSRVFQDLSFDSHISRRMPTIKGYVIHKGGLVMNTKLTLWMMKNDALEQDHGPLSTMQLSVMCRVGWKG